MSNAEDVYKEYMRRGGILGILKEKHSLFATSWEKHDIVKKLVQKANEVYLKIFPHGKKMRTGSEVIRRAGVVASYVARLKRRRDKRLKQIEPLAREFRDIVTTLEQYRDFFNTHRNYRGEFLELIKNMNKAKTESNVVKSADMIFNVIFSLIDLLKKLLDSLKNYNKLFPLQKLFLENYNYTTLWIEFRYVMTMDTGDSYWGERVLEIHLSTWSHAELLFHEATNKVMKDLVTDILDETNNSWLLKFSDASDIFEYYSKELLNHTSGKVLKKVPFNFKLYDHNYSMVRVETVGRPEIPADWQRYDAKTLKHDYILETGDIVYYEVRGQRGRLGKGSKLLKVKKTFDGKEIYVIKGYEEGGVQKSIEDFLKRESLKKKEQKS